jgi:GT2 family glycosyltransferase
MSDQRHVSTEIIIVSWNGRRDTLRAIESIQPQIGTGPGRVDGVTVTVVDNGSTDGTSEVVSRRFPKVAIRRLPENRGFTGGVAAGVAASASDLVILLNNDAVVEDGWLESLIQSIEHASDDVVAVSGRILDERGERADFVGGVMTFDGHGFQPGFHHPLDSVEEPETGAELLFACGGNMIVRRRQFLELGGFDDDYFAYMEDVDFGWRAWLSGHRILYSREAEVRHRSAATSSRLGDFERGVLFEKNAAQTILKNLEDAAFREMAGSVFLALLHRLHRYSVDRNDHRGQLTRPPLGAKSASDPSRRSFLDRIRTRLRGSSLTIDDPLTIMQFRATEWILQNADEILRKREEIQKMRRRTDDEIFRRFPLVVVPTYHGDAALFASRLFEMLAPTLPFERRDLDEMTRV